jgi:hypothetical protein
MRLYRLSPREVEGIAEFESLWGLDRRGNPIFVGRSGDGRPMKVVMALDAPDFVITVYGERK